MFLYRFTTHIPQLALRGYVLYLPFPFRSSHDLIFLRNTLTGIYFIHILRYDLSFFFTNTGSNSTMIVKIHVIESKNVHSFQVRKRVLQNCLYANSENPDQTVYTRCLIRAFTVYYVFLLDGVQTFWSECVDAQTDMNGVRGAVCRGIKVIYLSHGPNICSSNLV